MHSNGWARRSRLATTPMPDAKPPGCYQTLNEIQAAYWKPGGWAAFGEEVGTILALAGLTDPSTKPPSRPPQD